MKQGTLDKFIGLLKSIDSLNYEDVQGVELYRCKVTLKDESNLRIAEKYWEGVLQSYAYYWLTKNNELIIGWDCAPHHPQIKSYPHHKHVAGKKTPVASNERNLADVLAFIAKRLK